MPSKRAEYESDGHWLALDAAARIAAPAREQLGAAVFGNRNGSELRASASAESGRRNDLVLHLVSHPCFLGDALTRVGASTGGAPVAARGGVLPTPLKIVA